MHQTNVSPTLNNERFTARFRKDCYTAAFVDLVKLFKSTLPRDYRMGRLRNGTVLVVFRLAMEDRLEQTRFGGYKRRRLHVFTASSVANVPASQPLKSVCRRLLCRFDAREHHHRQPLHFHTVRGRIGRAPSCSPGIRRARKYSPQAASNTGDRVAERECTAEHELASTVRRW